MNSIKHQLFRIQNIGFPHIFIKRTKKHFVVKPDYYTIEDSKDSSYKKSSQTYVNTLAVLHKKDITWAEIKEWLKGKNIASVKHDQRFIPQRHKALGPDIATAQFITARGGKVRFKGNEKWLDLNSLKRNEIPFMYVPNIYVESVDASNTELRYEGFSNLINLFHIKELILRNCEYIDDFVLHRLNIMHHSLEKLDISGCQNVTEYGICTLHNLKQLKLLIVHDTPNFLNKELTCILLQDIIPNLRVEGVDYDSSALRRRLKKYL